MRNEINRVAADLDAWRNREERFEKLFPGTLRNNRPFLKEKLNCLDNIQAKYGHSANEEERFTLKILKQERNNLARKVYARPIVRLLYLIVFYIRQTQTEQSAIVQAADNIQSLNERVAKMGLGQVGPQLEQRIKEGQAAFTIPVSYYVNEKERMDYALSFSKDQTGQYQMDSYKASLSKESDPKETRQQIFYSEQKAPTAEQAYNLLSGRAVRYEPITRDQNWIQLDFNDKDASGNFRIKEFPARYGYDLNHAIQQLPFSGSLSADATEKLVRSLEAGDRPEITFQKDGTERKVFVEANPQFKSLTIYDERAKKISLSSLRGDQNKQRPVKRIPLGKVVRKARNKGISA